MNLLKFYEKPFEWQKKNPKLNSTYTFHNRQQMKADVGHGGFLRYVKHEILKFSVMKWISFKQEIFNLTPKYSCRTKYEYKSDTFNYLWQGVVGELKAINQIKSHQ